jgi:hypothetical protein
LISQIRYISAESPSGIFVGVGLHLQSLIRSFR